MPKNKQLDLIASVKTPQMWIYYKLRNKTGGGGYPVLVNYQSLLSNILSLASPIIFIYKIYTKSITASEFYGMIGLYDFEEN